MIPNEECALSGALFQYLLSLTPPNDGHISDLRHSSVSRLRLGADRVAVSGVKNL